MRTTKHSNGFTGRPWLAGILVLVWATLLVCSQITAEADQHWTTNGVHKGILQTSVQAGSPSGLDDASTQGGRDYLGEYRLGYALWSLMGEPVHDYVFTWDWRDADLVVAEVKGRTITTRDLAKYPDLARHFRSFKPISVTVEAPVEFYDAAEHRFASAAKTIEPDMIDQAGVPDPLHVPGSPDWADFFQPNAPGGATREGLATSHQKLFAESASVRLARPRLTAIEWPEAMLQFLAQEFVRREAAEQAEANEPKPKPADGLNPLERAVAAERQLNPLELARRGIRTTPENPLEKSVRLQREEEQRQAAIRREEERQAELAREEERAEEARREAEEQRRREYAETMERLEREAEARSIDAAYQRAVARQRRDRDREQARRPDSYATLIDELERIGRDVSRPGSGVDMSFIRAPLPSTRSGANTSRTAAGRQPGYTSSTAPHTCSNCNGFGYVLDAESKRAEEEWAAEIERNKGKGGVIPARPEGKGQKCPVCGGRGTL